MNTKALRTAQATLIAEVLAAAATAPTVHGPEGCKAAGMLPAPLVFTAAGCRFEVNGGREDLERFAAKVKRSHGFAPARARAIGRDGGTSFHVPAAAKMAAAESQYGHRGDDSLIMMEITRKAAIVARLRAGAVGSVDGYDYNARQRATDAQEIELIQREMVRRGLLDATDHDKVNADPVDESELITVQDNATAPMFADAPEAAPMPRARWNAAANTWQVAANDESAPPVPAAEIESTPPVPAPLAFIRITRAEGYTSGIAWPSGETRTFTGPAAWSAAHAALNQLCEDAPATGGYDKTDIHVEWVDGDVYAYRFDAQHASRSNRDTPDIARHILERLWFFQGNARPLHWTRAAYAGYIQQADFQENAAELLAMLTAHAFPLELTPPVLANDEPLPVPGRRCWYRGWGPGGADSGAGIVVAIGCDGDPEHHANVHFTIVLDHNGARQQFRLRDAFGDRQSVILGDAMASDIETSRADQHSAEIAAAEATDKATAQVRFIAEVDRLRAANPSLAPASDRNAVAVNIRRLFKAAGIRASVRTRRGGAYDVTMPADATDAQMDAAREICARFKSGHFDGMVDCYEYSRTPWNQAFGDAEYIFVQRDWSDAPAPTPTPEIESTPPVQADSSESTEELAHRRQICGTQVPATAQNSSTATAKRARARWNAAAGAWLPVLPVAA